jgi:hypothetical protein
MLDALDVLPPGRVTVDFCDPPTFPQLEKTISEAHKAGQPVHIVHFDGHGAYLPLTGVGALAFEHEDGATHLVTGAQLGDLLARLDVPGLLEACRSDLSGQPVFGSMAGPLQAGWAAYLQPCGPRGRPGCWWAFLRRARRAGIGRRPRRPHRLYAVARWLRNPDAETCKIGSSPALPGGDRPGADHGRRRPRGAPRRPRQDSLTASAAPLYRFHGRALLALERAFRRYPAALLSGMGGMGKTALAREAAVWWRRTGRFDAAVFCSFEQKAGAERVVQLLGRALERRCRPLRRRSVVRP